MIPRARNDGLSWQNRSPWSSRRARWVIEPHGLYGDEEIRTVTVEVRADALVASTGALLYSGQRPDLAGFFSDLAADYRGWAGKRRWASLEGVMAIEAWHDGRAHVMVAVTLHPPGGRTPRMRGPPAWCSPWKPGSK